jgi:hypothetical protein
MPSAGDSAVVSREQLFRKRDGIADAHAELEVQLASERQMEQGGVRNAARHAASLHPDLWHGEVGEQVVEPFEWGVNGK